MEDNKSKYQDAGSLEGKALYDAARSGCIFVENGLVGIKDADGNFLKSHGSDFKSVVYDGCDHFDYNDELTDSQVDGVETVLRWAVENGADASFVRNGESGLDLIDRFIERDNGKNSRFTKQLHRMRDNDPHLCQKPQKKEPQQAAFSIGCRIRTRTLTSRFRICCATITP